MVETKEEAKRRTEFVRRHVINARDHADRDGVARPGRNLQPVGERDLRQRQRTEVGKVVLRQVGGALARNRGILACDVN